MKLYYTPIKNYVHTVEAVIFYADLADRIEIVPTQPFDPDSPIAAVNPLGKVPALCLDGGECLGGPVIYEYLDSLHKRRKLHPAKGPQRWTALRRASLAEGLFDTVSSLSMESWLPREQQRPVFVQRNWSIVLRSLDQMERDVPADTRLDIGLFRTVGAVQFLKLKMPELGAATIGLDPRFDVAQGHPQLAAWIKSMSRKKMFRTPLTR